MNKPLKCLGKQRCFDLVLKRQQYRSQANFKGKDIPHAKCSVISEKALSLIANL